MPDRPVPGAVPPPTASGAAPDESVELRSVVSAVRDTSAVIELGLDGTVLTANQHYLDVMGYPLNEILGQNHRMLCDPAHAASAEYAALWESWNGKS